MSYNLKIETYPETNEILLLFRIYETGDMLDIPVRDVGDDKIKIINAFVEKEISFYPPDDNYIDALKALRRMIQYSDYTREEIARFYTLFEGMDTSYKRRILNDITESCDKDIIRKKADAFIKAREVLRKNTRSFFDAPKQ